MLLIDEDDLSAFEEMVRSVHGYLSQRTDLTNLTNACRILRATYRQRSKSYTSDLRAQSK